jgi:threonine aldolase
MPRTFRSDNNAGLCPEAMHAILAANDGAHWTGYGDDPFTPDAVKAFHRVFGDDARVWFVATGTAANTLAIASLVEPWQRVLCHAHSHVNADESTAPERFTHCRITAIDTETGKLTPDDVDRHGRNARGDVHEPQPGVVTISNPTEFGTVYTIEETRAICDTARRYNYRVHVDGARFANAVARLGCDPRDLSSRAGVDAISFGGTKNGLAFGEAVIFFPQGDGAACDRAASRFPFLRKSSGHLLSKHRFVSAPFEAVLRDGAWLRHAAHANSMADLLSTRLAALGLAIRYPTQANGVFVSLSEALHHGLVARGHQYYLFGDASWRMARLMCSFDTRAEEIEALAADAATLLARA